MLTIKASSTEPTNLDEIITKLELLLMDTPPETEKFSKIADQLVKLSKHRDDITSRSRVSADQWAMIGANLLGILAVLSYESVGKIVVSKSFSLVKKLG